MVLDKIQKENDIKKLTDTELAELATEIRNFLVENISQTGGHLASNLGVVELTMALHLAFDLPKDKIIRFQTTYEVMQLPKKLPHLLPLLILKSYLV